MLIFFFQDLLIKFTEESNDLETLSDDLNNIVSSHVPPEESLKNKNVIDVQIHELTRKESYHLDNLDLGTQPPVPVLKDKVDLWFKKTRRFQ